MVAVYLDVCCLNRPFDDQSQPRIRREAEAVLQILARIRYDDWEWLGSSTLDLEVRNNPNHQQREQIRAQTDYTTRYVSLEQVDEQRVIQLRALGFALYDSLHIAAAEAGKASVFLTTNDRLLKRARRCATELAVRVENPELWLLEVTP